MAKQPRPRWDNPEWSPEHREAERVMAEWDEALRLLVANPRIPMRLTSTAREPDEPKQKT